MGDAEDPGGEAGDVFEPFEILVRLQESILTEFQGILAAVDETQDVVVDTPIPAGDEEVERVHVAFSRLVNQVGIFDRGERSIPGSRVKKT